MENFWKTALKINLPATLVIFILIRLLNPVFSNIDFIERNQNLFLVLVILLINFTIIFLIINKSNGKKTIKKNVIDNNEIDGGIEINADKIIKNRISGNNIKNDLKIGKE